MSDLRILIRHQPLDASQIAFFLTRRGWVASGTGLGKWCFVLGNHRVEITASTTEQEWTLSISFADAPPNTIVGYRSPKSILEAVFAFLSQ